MVKRVNNLFYTLMAFTTAYFVNFIYEIGNVAHAAQACDPIIEYDYFFDRCTDTGNSVCGTQTSNWCASYGKNGWNCFIQTLDSGRVLDCACSSVYSSYFPNPTYGTTNCGVFKDCNGTKTRVSCVTAAGMTDSVGPGYIVSSSACACCPKPGSGIYGGLGSMFADYNATAASHCYLIGTFQDATGLFEYTDANRCYYVS